MNWDLILGMLIGSFLGFVLLAIIIGGSRNDN